jgi:ATP-dependent RNA helicase DDX46/PRP5
VLANVRPDRQLALFSATFPRAVDALARALLVKPLQLIVGGVSVVSSCIEQHVEVLAAEGKYRRLRELLDEFTPRGQALVFVERAEVADALFAQLVADRNVALCIHGRMDQADRDSAIADFKAAAAPVLVATSLAARGLDVRQLVLVCNYDVPTHYEDYVHRVGRVGRAERKGWAYTLLTPEQEKHAPDLVRALELANHDVPDDLAVLANTFADKKRAGLTGQGGKLGGFRKSGGKGLALDQASMDRQADKDRKVRAGRGGARARAMAAESSRRAGTRARSRRLATERERGREGAGERERDRDRETESDRDRGSKRQPANQTARSLHAASRRHARQRALTRSLTPSPSPSLSLARSLPPVPALSLSLPFSGLLARSLPPSAGAPGQVARGGR